MAQIEIKKTDKNLEWSKRMYGTYGYDMCQNCKTWYRMGGHCPKCSNAAQGVTVKP